MFEFIKNLFADKYSLRNNVKRDTDITASQIALDIEFEKDPGTQVSELLKKATTLKKTDMDQSILLIKQALKIRPSYSCYDKLINYLMIANKMDEAEELIIKLINESKDNKILFNFNNRAGNYERYADFLFKKGLYKEYIFYYCLSIYNRLVWETISEQIKCVKAELKNLRNKEIFSDEDTNKSFQELGVSLNQDLFIKTFCEILKSCQFDALYKLVSYLNNKQKDKEKLQIEGIKKSKDDWLLWSNKEFCDTIPNYDEQIFIKKYKAKLEILL